MALSRLNKSIMWIIKIISNQNFTNKERDFIVELVSEEARKTCGLYSFILHDIIESKRYSNIFIEGSRIALNNLLLVIKDNFLCKVAHRLVK